MKSITLRRGALLAGLAALALSGVGARAQAPQYDVIIRGGTLFDGSMAPRRKADLAIKGDRIAVVGEIPASATAGRVIDATGKFVTPGFIDPHSHTAPAIGTPELAAAMPVLHQGITSVLLNPDGGGPADLKPLMASIAKVTPGVNVAPMIGHNGVRIEVMGRVNRKATPAELARMQQLIRNAMDQGAFGMSSGPYYVPGKYSDTAELVAVAKAAAPYKDSFYISHIRDEATYDIGLVEATRELITVGREAKIKAIVTHQKALGPTVWGKSKDTADLIRAARAEGLDIWADQYPYAASGSSLQSALVPGWALEGGQEALAKRLQNPEQRALIRKDIVANLDRRAGPNALMIRGYAPDPSLEGKRLDEIARARLQDPVDTAIDLMIKGSAPTVSFNMNEDDVEHTMKQPWTMTSTDGALVPFGKGAEHPRAYGAFPRKFRRYVIERNTISWEQAIHSSSGLTATVFNFEDRGFLKPGYFADVVVLDPQTIRDTATYEKPHSYSVGVEHVFVNGQAALSDGKVTPQRHGRILLRNRAAAAD